MCQIRNGTRDARIPQPGVIVLDTMRYRSMKKSKDKRSVSEQCNLCKGAGKITIKKEKMYKCM